MRKAYSTLMGREFIGTAVSLLDKLIATGAVDGWTPSRIQPSDTWATMFSEIMKGTFKSRLARIRRKHRKAMCKKRT